MKERREKRKNDSFKEFDLINFLKRKYKKQKKPGGRKRSNANSDGKKKRGWGVKIIRICSSKFGAYEPLYTRGTELIQD